jgi:hypothetical protein
MSVTICALLYGDYPTLARRCLSSIASLNAALPPGQRCPVRIGMNAVSAATARVVLDLFSNVDYPVLGCESADNRCKYPVMRKLFYEVDDGIDTSHVMWFDDDSYIRTPTRRWLDDVLTTLGDAAMCGDIWRIGWQGRQREWVRAQPWYGGKDPALRSQLVFVTGGWWCASAAALRDLNYPWETLTHRGGDTMLGEALLQQGRRFVKFTTGVAINADETGRNAAARRRGFDGPPIGKDFIE